MKESSRSDAGKDRLIEEKVEAYRARIAAAEASLGPGAAGSAKAVRLDGADPVEEYRAHLARAERDGDVFGDEAKFGARTPFQIDRDRILYSSFFMPLALKTQMVIGQHTSLLRNRLSHTLVVANIARSIAQGLDLNVDLTEAVALGHDIGHAPFGHAGERTLNRWLKRRVVSLWPQEAFAYNALPSAIGEHFLLQPDEGAQDPDWRESLFQHGRQGVRKLEVFENNNLTRQTLFGIWRHSAKHARTDGQFAYAFQKDNSRNKNSSNRKGKTGSRELDHRYASYEAQVVRIADDIAWAVHDLDDALRAGLVSLETIRGWKVPQDGDKLLTKHLDDYELGPWVRRFISGVVDANINLDKTRLAEDKDGLTLKEPLNTALKSLMDYVKTTVGDHPETQRAEGAVDRLLTSLADAYWNSSSDLRADLEQVLAERGQTKSGLETLRSWLSEKRWVEKATPPSLAVGGGKSKTKRRRENPLVERAALICDFLSALTDEEAMMLLERHYSPRFRLPPALSRFRSQ